MMVKGPILIAAAAGLLATAATAQVPGTQPVLGATGTAAGLAQDILSTVEPGSRVALRPLRGTASNLTSGVARDLYEAVLDGLFEASGGAHTILTRERLNQVYDTCEEFFTCGDYAARLEAARAEVEVQCAASPGVERVRLFCSAVDIETTVTVGRGSGDFPLASLAPAQDWAQAMAGIAAELNAAVALPGSLGRAHIIDQTTGTHTDFAALLTNKLRFELGRRMTLRQGDLVDTVQARRQLGYEDEPLPVFPAYVLNGVIWPAGESRVTLTVDLNHDGRTLALASVDIARDSIPVQFRESASPNGLVSASAQAIPSARLDRQSAIRAATNLARARLIAQAMGTQGPAVGMIATEADATQALGDALSLGMPYDEVLEVLEPADTDGRISVHLTGRVAPVGRNSGPDIRAALSRSIYETGDAIALTISSDRAARIGIFAWGADNRVVRVYPVDGIAAPELMAGDAVTLPAAAEDRQIQSAPLELDDIDNPEDHEMLILIAADQTLAFETLAPPLGADAQETAARATDGAGFFQALAAHDLSAVTILALPYQIRE
ncbi:MAG: hypothetical protein JJ878_21570 [Alphaproteobacteria bacterium]|nr:hypothetical protein [Alphaproteobacteria bacterium]MBO6865225.1 hypothetical protein [Alphaproteobacteria bacterium]